MSETAFKSLQPCGTFHLFLSKSFHFVSSSISTVHFWLEWGWVETWYLMGVMNVLGMTGCSAVCCLKYKSAREGICLHLWVHRLKVKITIEYSCQ